METDSKQSTMIKDKTTDFKSTTSLRNSMQFQGINIINMNQLPLASTSVKAFKPFSESITRLPDRSMMHRSVAEDSTLSKNRRYALHKLEEITRKSQPKHVFALQEMERLAKSQIKSSSFMADLIEMKPCQSTMLKRVYYHGTKLVPMQPKKSKRAGE
jgi:hypothetical protein